MHGDPSGVGLRPALGPLQRQFDHALGVQPGVELPVDLLQRLKLLHAQGQGTVGLCVHAGVLDGDRCLAGKGLEHLAIALVEQGGADPVVDVDHADHSATRAQRDTQHRAQRVGDNQLLRPKAVIRQGVRRDDALAGLQHFLDHRAADLDVLRAEVLALIVAPDLNGAFAGLLVEQQQEATLGSGELDDRVHHLLQHLVQQQRRPDGTRDLIQGKQPGMLAALLQLGGEIFQIDQRLLGNAGPLGIGNALQALEGAADGLQALGGHVAPRS